MPPTLIGRKVGMTRLYDGEGRNIPVTVIQAGPCYVSQIKTIDVDGYDGVQLAFEDVKGVLKPNGVVAMYNYYRQGWIIERAVGMAEKTFGNRPNPLYGPRGGG